MGRFEFLKNGGIAAAASGAAIAGGAFIIEFLGLDPTDEVPAAFTWVEGIGGAVFGLGMLGLIGYKIANPSWPEDDRDHWRDNYH